MSTSNSASLGRSFVKVAIALSQAKGDLQLAAAVGERLYGRTAPEVGAYLKTLIDFGGVDGASWTGALARFDAMAREFQALTRPRTIIGRLTGARRVPFLTRAPLEDDPAGSGWVAEGRPIPVSALALSSVVLRPLKIATIVVLAEDLLSRGLPGSEDSIRASLVRSVVAGMDASFIDPAIAASDGGPASVTHDAVVIPSSGSTAAAVSADLELAMKALSNAGTEFVDPYWVMSPTTAIHLAFLRDASGSYAFPNVSVLGGSLGGVPVLTSSSVPTASSGASITLLDADQLLIADDGDIALGVSGAATLQMKTDPTSGANDQTSLFQTDAVALRVVRRINWRMARPGAVAVVTGIAL